MSEKKLTCTVCGKEYEACITCQNAKTYSSWRNLVDSMEHYKLFILARDYGNGRLNKDDAKTKIKELDISGFENWNTITGRLICEILKKDDALNVATTTSNISKRASKIKAKSQVTSN